MVTCSDNGIHGIEVLYCHSAVELYASHTLRTVTIARRVHEIQYTAGRQVGKNSTQTLTSFLQVRVATCWSG